MSMKIKVKHRPQFRRLLSRLFILVVSIVVILSVYRCFWLVKEKHLYSEQSHSADEQKSESPDDGNTQSPPTLESPIINVTPIPVIDWNQVSKSRLPWYFKGGLRYPERAAVDHRTGVRVLKLWPEEQMHGDRVEEQLMFVPPHYMYENAPIKRILLFNGINDWMIETGQSEFLSNDCPVNRCTIHTSRKEMYTMDAIVFRDDCSGYIPGGYGPAKQVRILYVQQSARYEALDDISENSINWTASYRRDSDIVVPYGRWAYYNNNPLVTQGEQLKRNYAQNKRRPVAAVISECDTDNGRMSYARELDKYIRVDIYGQCGDFDNTTSDQFFETLAQDYRFYLAFENSNGIGYITEKFFVNGLGYDMLPIAMGGRKEDYELVAPNHSYLHVDDFESPEELSKYLIRLSGDDDLYNEYFRWKGSGEFIDTRFFCRLCAVLHDESAPIKHYQNVSDWWRGREVNNQVRKRQVKLPPSRRPRVQQVPVYP